MQEGRLDVARWTARYLVPRRHPAPETIRSCLDPQLREGLAHLPLGIPHETDASVWIVRRLELAFAVNLAWPSGRIGEACRAALAQRLRRLLSQGGNAELVRRYDDRAAWLAAFVADLAAGRAWSQWQYAPFEPLRVLPVSRALLAALTESPAGGLCALTRLAPRARLRVADALSRQDARTLTEVLTSGAGPPGTVSASMLEDVWQAWRRLNRLDHAPAQGWPGTLQLALEVAAGGNALGPHVRRACAAILALIGRMESARTGEPVEPLLEALERGPLAAVYRAAPGDVESLTPLLHAPRFLLDDIANTIRAPAAPLLAQPDVTRRWTRFGGAFVLLPILAGWRLDSAIRRWPDLGARATALLRTVVLARALSGTDARTVARDPLLQELCGVERPDDLKIVERWQGAGRLAAWLLRAFARRLPGFARSGDDYLRHNLLDFAASLEDWPGRRVARLAPAKLAVVLDITGMTRASWRLPWGDRRPVAVFPDERA